MLQGYPLSAIMPEEFGLGERFWYWRGASGQSYIHSIYPRDLCPAVPGAVFVLVRRSGSRRTALAAGRFGQDGSMPAQLAARACPDEEVHVHLLTREEEGAERILRDLRSAMGLGDRPGPELRAHVKPVQLELLLAA